MTTAKLFMNGRSQAVRLPKECRFDEGEEVIIKKVGDAVMLIPKSKWKELFSNAVKDFSSEINFERAKELSGQVRKLDL